MSLDESQKEILGVAGVNTTICRDFAEFYSDYGFVSQWADIASAETLDLAEGIHGRYRLAAVAIEGTVMNGRNHDFRYIVHKYNSGPFSEQELAAIAKIVGLPSEVIIMSDDEKANRQPYYRPVPDSEPACLVLPFPEIAA